MFTSATNPHVAKLVDLSTQACLDVAPDTLQQRDPDPPIGCFSRCSNARVVEKALRSKMDASGVEGLCAG